MRKIVRWMWLPVVLILGYSAWVLYSRQADNKRIAEQAEQRKADQDRQIVEKVGGGELKVLTFYANPPAIRRGETALLCYGVASADSVTIDPPVDGVGPALSRCVETKPIRTTTYTLKAERQGRDATSTTVVTVAP